MFMVATIRGVPVNPATLTLKKLSLALSALRVLDETMPMQTAVLFLEIAQHEGEGITELAERAGMTQQSASRNIAALGEWHWLKRPGLKLVETEPDPMEMRKKLVKLTAKGRTVIEQITAALEKGGTK